MWGNSFPCFGLLVTSAVGFKAKVDPLLCILHHLCAMDSSDSQALQDFVKQCRKEGCSNTSTINASECLFADYLTEHWS